MAQLKMRHQEELTELHKKRGEVKMATLPLCLQLSAGLVVGRAGRRDSIPAACGVSSSICGTEAAVSC